MKKILSLIVFLLISLWFYSCAVRKPITPYKVGSITLQDVNVGASANDHTGDPIRTAFQKGNSNNTIIENAFANTYTVADINGFLALKANLASPTFSGTVKIGADTAATKADARANGISLAQSGALYRDSTNLRVTNAYNLTSLSPVKPDSNQYDGYITRAYFETYGGGGGGGTGGYEWTSWIVGTTSGAPANADTSFTISEFAGDRIELYRGTTADLHEQWLNETATNGKTGYRYNSSGIIVVRPAWSTGDRAYLRAVPSGYTTKITLAGGGSTLLTNLVEGWKLDEPSGTTAFGVNSTYNGTIYGATVNSVGKFGHGYLFDGVNDYVSMGTTAGLRPTGTFSLSFWVRTASVTQSGLVTNYLARSGPLIYGISILMMADGTLEAQICDGDATPLVTLTSASTINDDVYHRITLKRDAANAYLLIDGVQVDTDGCVGSAVYNALNEFRLGDRGEGDWPLNGYIDDVYLWTKLLSAGEETTLQSNTHPW